MPQSAKFILARQRMNNLPYRMEGKFSRLDKCASRNGRYWRRASNLRTLLQSQRDTVICAGPVLIAISGRSGTGTTFTNSHGKNNTAQNSRWLGGMVQIFTGAVAGQSR